MERFTGVVYPALWAQILNTQAGLTYHLGQAESALERWQQAENFYEQANDLSGMPGSQINQAQALQSLGLYQRSRQQLEAITEKLRAMPDSTLKVNGLRTLGLTLQVLGDLSSSREVLLESANIAVAIEAINELSVTYLSLGKAASNWGDPAAAIAMFERAKEAALTPADALQADLMRLQFYVETVDVEKSAHIAQSIAEQLQSMPPIGHSMRLHPMQSLVALVRPEMV